MTTTRHRGSFLPAHDDADKLDRTTLDQNQGLSSSEAGGQGLQVLGAFQDLSQERHRWGEAADGFLSLFSQKLIFRGIADEPTLRALELLSGDWEQPITTASRGGPDNSVTTSMTTQRVPELTAARIAKFHHRRALSMSPRGHHRVELTPFYVSPFWTAALSAAAPTEPAGEVIHLSDERTGTEPGTDPMVSR